MKATVNNIDRRGSSVANSGPCLLSPYIFEIPLCIHEYDEKVPRVTSFPKPQPSPDKLPEPYRGKLMSNP